MEVLHYNSITGVFTWIRPLSNRTAPGTKAGSISSSGYLHVQIDGKLHNLHRLAWLYIYGEFPEREIDHKNGIKTDNRISNLRDVSKSANLANITIRSDNKSGYKGVYYNVSRKKWMAQISIKGAKQYLGSFDTAEEAKAAYETKFVETHAEDFKMEKREQEALSRRYAFRASVVPLEDGSFAVFAIDLSAESLIIVDNVDDLALAIVSRANLLQRKTPSREEPRDLRLDELDLSEIGL